MSQQENSAGGPTGPDPDSAPTETVTARPAPPLPSGAFSLSHHLLRRLLGGLLFVLPVLITVFVIYQVYVLLNSWLIEPVALVVIPRGIENRYWNAVETYVTPPLSLVAVLVLLYLLGYLFQTRLHRLVDWTFHHIPGVATIYRAIRDVAVSMRGTTGWKKIDTVVLVPFPHEGARMAGYLMGESVDSNSGAPLACVYIPMGVFPPSGYTLVCRTEDVIKTDWGTAAPWKLLLSGGLTLPESVPFERGE